MKGGEGIAPVRLERGIKKVPPRRRSAAARAAGAWDSSRGGVGKLILRILDIEVFAGCIGGCEERFGVKGGVKTSVKMSV